MATFSRIAIDEPTTIDKNAATVQIDRGGTLDQQEIVVLGDSDSSLAIGRVVDTAPDSTHFGLVVRQVGHSTTVNVSSVAGRVAVGEYSTAAPAADSTGLVVRVASPSTGPFAISSVVGVVFTSPVSTASMRVAQSTAGDLQVTATQGGTWNIGTVTTVSAITTCSSVAGIVTITPVSTASVRVAQSTAGDLHTTARIADSSGTAIVGTTTRPSTGANALAVREVLNDLLSTAFSTMGNNSTSSTIVSSAAGVRHKVYAYSITSTVQAVNSLSFASGLANVIWTIQNQSISSGISGANLAVTPPAWLFATAAAEPLVFKIGPSTGSYHLSFSYFSEA